MTSRLKRPPLQLSNGGNLQQGVRVHYLQTEKDRAAQRSQWTGETGQKESVTNEKSSKPDTEINQGEDIEKVKKLRTDDLEFDWKTWSKWTKKEADRIIGATKIAGKILLLMKWKGTDEADLVPATAANWLYPQKVIDYYESRVVWNRKTEGDETTDN